MAVAAAALLGREAECACLDRLLEEARAGRSGALVLRGEAGIGKTALLAYAIGAAGGMEVLSACAIESEGELPFAALHSLFRPALGLIDSLPTAQARALKAALALEPEEADPLAAAAGTLSLLAELAEAAPLLVAVDDAQWLDRASAAALLFAARRLAGEGIVLLFALRDELAVEFDTSGLDVLVVEGLDLEAAEQLLSRVAGSAFAAGVAQAFARATAGNPLALTELPALLSEGQLAGLEALEEPLPVTEQLGRAFLLRVRRLTPETQKALVVAAAGADGERAAVADATAALGITPDALDAAEAAGLLAVRAGAIAFRHPLVRSAVYQAAAPAQRRAAHRALAGAEQGDRRAWHLAAAAEGPDEQTAAALEAAAERARSRGGYASQSRALARAAELSTDDEARARRLLAASRAAYRSGEPARAIRLADDARSFAHDPLLRADVVAQRARLANWQGLAVSEDELEREASQVESLDPERAASLLGPIIGRRLMRLDAPGALALAKRRAAMCAPLEGRGHVWTLQELAYAHALGGNSREAGTILDEIVDSPYIETGVIPPFVWLERYAEARRLIERSLERARERGNVVRVIFDLTQLTLLSLRVDLRAAHVAVVEAIQLAEQTENEYLLACNLPALAYLDAIAGRGDDCRRRASQAIELARKRGDTATEAEAQLALGLLALGEGEAKQAIEQLEPLARLTETNEVEEPSVLPFAPDLIEAYARAGEIGAARQALARFRRQAQATERRWALACAARCEGLLADDDDVDAPFIEALERHERAGSPFDRGRTELSYGERLRRLNRRKDARPHLRAAIEVFDELAAAPWAERTRAELRATGEQVPRRTPTAPEQLTPQELQIALLAAEGKTNREAGSALFLSPKTIDFHLGRVYRKLDIHSRAELIRLFARDETNPSRAAARPLSPSA